MARKKNASWSKLAAKGMTKKKSKDQNEKESEAVKEKPKMVCKMKICEAHDKFGHHNIRRCKEMAKVLEVQLIGDDLKCDACALINSKQRAVSKTTHKKASRIGEQLFIDASGPFPVGINSLKYIFGAVDNFSGKMLYAFGSSRTRWLIL